MDTTRFSQQGIAILRVVLGIVFLAHGWQKAFTMGLGGVAGFFTQIGIPLPALAAVVVTTVELVGGLALMVGLGTRFVTIPLAIDMLAATLVFHLRNGFFITDGGVEFTLVLAAGAIALATIGPGAWALDNLMGRHARTAPLHETLPG
ncbi:MAG: DoxX family protein [Longimicrobiales bacterium]